MIVSALNGLELTQKKESTEEEKKNNREGKSK